MDARIRYTKRVIREKFLQMLQEMPVERITVTALCERAEINRATFYRYYENPADLLMKLEKELLDEIREAMEALTDRSMRSVARAVLEQMRAQKGALNILFSDNGDAHFADTVLAFCYSENMRVINETFPDMSDQHKQWLYYFLGEGCNGIFKQWIAQGMKEDPAELVDFMGRIVDTVNAHL